MMAIVAPILFSLCTLDITIGFSRDYRAFVLSDDATTSLIRDWANIARPVVESLAAWVADFILGEKIYRCWVVYGRNWLVIVPSTVLYLANLAISFKTYSIIGEAGGIPGATVPANSGNAFEDLNLAFFATIAAQNVLTSSILIWRIWSVEREQANLFDGTPRYELRRIITVIAESGAAYTTFVLLSLITDAAHSNGLYVTSDFMAPTAGMAFNIILIRCSPERDRQFTTYGQVSTLRAAHQTTTLASEPTIYIRQNDSRDKEFIGTDGRSSHSNLSKAVRIAKKVEAEV
ncbi:Serpentine receptor class alpha-27 [Leucoagaricus sp. SymC.cos]|nr:Serpentine receptor class alpha-27 [Leucoagaricus sp. SymC.cos]